MDIKTLVQQYCDYAIYYRNLSTRTIKRYKYVFDFYLKFSGIAEISEFTPESIRELLFHGRTKRNWKTNTYLVFHKTFTTFSKWCVKQKYLDKNPMDDIEKPKLDKTLPIKLTKQESVRLLEVVLNYPYPDNFTRMRNHAVFACFLYTGIRRRELLNLHLTDIDLDNLRLFVRRGKGAKDRFIPIHVELASILNRYIAERVKMNKTCPEFFTSTHFDSGFSCTTLKRITDTIRKSTNFQFTIHKLRHTFATLMLEGGCDIFSLSQMMGHSDIKTTTIYLSTTVNHLKNQMMKHPLSSY